MCIISTDKVSHGEFLTISTSKIDQNCVSLLGCTHHYSSIENLGYKQQDYFVCAVHGTSADDL